MTARFTVKSEVDFIALAPVVLGFQPTHSLVMLTVDSFHARIDVPDADSINDCVDALLSPTLKHKVGRVAFVLFDDGDNEALKTALMDQFTASDIQVLAALEVRDGCYRRFNGDWQPLDIASHHMSLEAQYLDVAPKHHSRAELVSYIKPVGEAWPADVAVSVELLHRVGVDGILMSLTRERVKEQAELWTKALRGCDDPELVSDIAIVLAFAAWLSGDGAKAWVALDLADKSSTWHRLLTAALEQAIPPSSWFES